MADLIENATPDQRDRMRYKSINLQTLNKAIWKLNKGAAPGIDGITREDIIAFPIPALEQMLLQGLNGRMPMANGPMLAGASPTFQTWQRPHSYPRCNATVHVHAFVGHTSKHWTGKRV